MGAVLLSPLYLLLNVYLISRMLLWFRTLHSFLGSPWFVIPFITCYILLALSPLAAAFAPGKMRGKMRILNNYWLGTLMYLLIFLLLADLVRIFYCLATHQSLFSAIDANSLRITGGIIFSAVLLISIYGISHAAHIKKTSYEVSVQKNASIPELKIALVADLHLGGSIGLKQMQRMKDVIDTIQPDLVVFAGDIFDNDFDAIQNPVEIAALLASIDSTYGSFACWGNHDIDELILAGFTFDSGSDAIRSDPRMDQFLKDSGITLLQDETLLIDHSFYLIGRLDASCKKKSGIIRRSAKELTTALRLDRPVIVIDHQPSELDALADAHADLVLSGHTHDGQLFPGNLTTRIGWKNSCGMIRIQDMTSIVTSGVGVWGPAMRIGTNSEVAEITVHFAAPHAPLSREAKPQSTQG